MNNQLGQDTSCEASKSTVSDIIPPQFRYPEYEELDDYLTSRFGLPFTYKRFNPSSYHYIPYGYNYTYLAEPKNFCSNGTFMVVMIMSTVRKPKEQFYAKPGLKTNLLKVRKSNIYSSFLQVLTRL